MSEAFCIRTLGLGATRLALVVGASYALAGSMAQAQSACVGTGAHDAHSGFASGCAACHPCGGQVGFSGTFTLPSGRLVTGTMTTTAQGTSCTVACHAPVGQTPPTVNWTMTEPFACSTCHLPGQAPPAGGSGHPFDLSSAPANRTDCMRCHDLSGHVSGTVRVHLPDGTIVAMPRGGTVDANPLCEGCHLGNGQTLSGKSPPLVDGWYAAAGDWHGARAGTGSGGTLASPYTRGQAPIACTACHDPHLSYNAFHFRQSVNGQAVPAAVVSRAGVGAEQVCTACHVGTRHQYCIGCHGVDPQPAGSACFACHGHEGIRYFPWPTTPPHNNGPRPGAPGDCWHCHTAGWAPNAPNTIAPVVSAVTVAEATSYSATLTWTTDKAASSFVEYGTTSPASVVGSGALTQSHSVTLAGLTGLTTYTFRVRSADLYRNVTESTLATFQTADPYAPLAPVLDPGPYIYTYDAGVPVYLSWSIVTSPANNPVQYRVVVDTRSTFTAPVADSGWISTPSYTAFVPALWWPDEFYWRVQARDAVTGSASQWSTVGTFAVWINMY